MHSISVSLAGKMPALQTSINLQMWDAPHAMSLKGRKPDQRVHHFPESPLLSLDRLTHLEHQRQGEVDLAVDF
jgi:hypothetical protein